MLTGVYFGNWHPLTLMSHALDIQLFGFNPAGHHWVSVFWHIGCSWLLYYYGLRILPKLLPQVQLVSATHLTLISGFAALLFAVHPLRVESVAWVAERKDLLCGFFYLLCLIFYDSYVSRPTLRNYCLTFLSAVLAILSKPMAVSLPLVLFILDLGLYKRLQFCFWNTPNWKLIVLEKIPFIMFSALSVYMTLEAQSSIINANSSILIRMANSLNNWVRYLSVTLVPIGLSPFYPYIFEIFWLKVLMNLSLLVGLFVCADFYRRRGQTWLLLALCFYSITLLPVIGIVQVGAAVMADRYTYISTMPIYFILAVIAFKLVLGKVEPSGVLRLVRVRYFVLVALPMILMLCTFRYTIVWQNDLSLWKFVQNKFPSSYYAIKYLGKAYYFNDQLEEAIEFYRIAFNRRLEIRSNDPKNSFVYRYFDAAFKLEQFEEAEAALFMAWREKRIGYKNSRLVFYEAARVSVKLGKYKVALKLLDQVSGTFDSTNGRVNEVKIKTMKSDIQDLIDRKDSA